MRNLAIASVFVMLLAPAAMAGPKDQSSNPMVATQSLDGNDFVDNFATAITLKSKGCPLQLAMKGVSGVGDGELLICLAEGDVIAPPAIPQAAGNQVVIAVEASKGSVKAKIDLTEIGCGSTDSVSFNGNFKCFLDDGVFLGSDSGSNWQHSCSVAGMIPIPNASQAAAKLKLNPEQNVVVGLCQGLSVGKRMDPPASTEIARQGSLTR